MKKLLFAVTTDLNHDQRMQRICGSLAAAGYDVELVGRSLPGSKPLLPRPYRQHRLQCRFSKGKLFYLEFMCRLYLYLGRKKYDAYCAIDLDTALPVYFRAKSMGKPFVYDAHEYFPEVVEVTDRKTVKAIWTAIEGFIVRRTQYAYTVSESIAGIFQQKYNTRFAVIRNVPPRQPFEPPAQEPGTILYQGAVNAGRGLEQLIHAMAGLDARLIVCGNGDVLPQLRVLADQLNISHKVEFRGQVLPAELLQITRRCQVGAMLLENRGLSYYYSLANKFFDYIHAGVPQLVVDFPEYRQLNQKYEVGLLTSMDVAEIRQKLALLLTDRALHDKLIKNCELAREKLNWQQEEKKLVAFYQQLWEV